MSTEYLEHCRVVALIEAARSGHEKMIHTLLEVGADVHAALRVAAGKESVDVVQRLLDAGADARWWSMQAACKNAQELGNTDVARLIQKRMAV